MWKFAKINKLYYGIIDQVQRFQIQHIFILLADCLLTKTQA